MTDLFRPYGMGQTVSISATTSSASASLPGGVGPSCSSGVFYNAGPNDCFVRWGKGSQTATTSDIPCPAGSVQSFHTDFADTFAAICATGTATLRVTPGNGE